MTHPALATMVEAAEKATVGLWFVAGVRQKLDGQQALGVMWYNEADKRDENIASVWYDPRNGCGTTDAAFIALANPANILSLAQYVKGLEEALFPFADAAETYLDDSVPDYAQQRQNPAWQDITAADFRRAAAALSGGKP